MRRWPLLGFRQDLAIGNLRRWSATFSEPGTYVVRALAADGGLMAHAATWFLSVARQAVAR